MGAGTKTSKLQHVISKTRKVIDAVTPSIMLNCFKEKLKNHTNQQNNSMINSPLQRELD